MKLSYLCSSFAGLENEAGIFNLSRLQKKPQYLAYLHLTSYLHLTMISLMFLRLWITKRCTLICKILLKLKLILPFYHCLIYAGIRVLSDLVSPLENAGQRKSVFLQIVHNLSLNYLCDRNLLFQTGSLM